mgnify:CR=1 FL=1
MATAHETAESTDGKGNDSDLTATDKIDACETLGQLKELDGEVIDRTETDGRVRERCLRVISDPDQISWIESGDKTIHNDGRQSDIVDIGSDICDSPGLHIQEKRENGESPVHLRLIQRWLRKGYLVIVGVRTREFAERPDVSD